MPAIMPTVQAAHAGLAAAGPGAGRPLDCADPRLDRRGGDRLEGKSAERGQQLRVNYRPVPDQRRGLAAAVVLDVAQPLRGGVDERGPGTHHPGQDTPPGFVEPPAKPVLGAALGHIAGRRAPAPGPGRTDLTLNLTPVRQPVLRVPDRAARPLDPEDVP